MSSISFAKEGETFSTVTVETRYLHDVAPPGATDRLSFMNGQAMVLLFTASFTCSWNPLVALGKEASAIADPRAAKNDVGDLVVVFTLS